MIFETERLFVRKLVRDDLFGFHEMQSNPKVMLYAEGEVQNLEEHALELDGLIAKYNKPNNDFWIYAVERKSDSCFVGTVAVVKDACDDEIGYRFLEIYWGNGYATEICSGLIRYCKSMGFEKLIAYVISKNTASLKILERFHFKRIEECVLESQLTEFKYELYL